MTDLRARILNTTFTLVLSVFLAFGAIFGGLLLTNQKAYAETCPDGYECYDSVVQIEINDEPGGIPHNINVASKALQMIPGQSGYFKFEFHNNLPFPVALTCGSAKFSTTSAASLAQSREILIDNPQIPAPDLTGLSTATCDGTQFEGTDIRTIAVPWEFPASATDGMNINGYLSIELAVNECVDDVCPEPIIDPEVDPDGPDPGDNQGAGGGAAGGNSGNSNNSDIINALVKTATTGISVTALLFSLILAIMAVLIKRRKEVEYE